MLKIGDFACLGQVSVATLLSFGLAFSFLLLTAINRVGLGAALFTHVGKRPVSPTYFIQG